MHGRELNVSNNLQAASHAKPALVIPRAKVYPNRGYNGGYHSDDERLSTPVEVRAVVSVCPQCFSSRSDNEETVSLYSEAGSYDVFGPT